MIATFAGVAIGTLAAVSRGGPFDWFSLSVALVGISLPGFVSAAASLRRSSTCDWHLFPVGGLGFLRDVIMPGLAISLAPMAYITRLTRASMIDVLSSDYIRTARAKGFPIRWSSGNTPCATRFSLS